MQLPKAGINRLYGKIIFLTYHSFSTRKDVSNINRTQIKQFEKQLLYIKKNFQVIGILDAIDILKGKIEPFVEKPMAVITVDDGFSDNYELMFPLTVKYDTPVTIYLATDFIDTERPPWPIQIVEIVDRTKMTFIDYPEKMKLTERKDKIFVIQSLKKLWGKLPPSERFKNLEELRYQLKVNSNFSYRPLTWNQIREMNRSTITFGSHTVYHSILTLVSNSIIEKEIRLSKKRIEEELDSPCITFAKLNCRFNNFSFTA